MLLQEDDGEEDDAVEDEAVPLDASLGSLWLSAVIDSNIFTIRSSLSFKYFSSMILKWWQSRSALKRKQNTHKQATIKILSHVQCTNVQENGSGIRTCCRGES